MAASRVVPRTPQHSQLLDSQTKHDLLRLTVQQTRGPISRLRAQKKRRKKKEERSWASPSVALCRVVSWVVLYVGHPPPHNHDTLVIAESTSDAAATWRGRLFVINAPITTSVIAVLGQNDICGRNLPSLGAVYCSSQYSSFPIHYSFRANRGTPFPGSRPRVARRAHSSPSCFKLLARG